MILEKIFRILKVLSYKGSLRQILSSKTFSISSFELVKTLHQYENDISVIIDAGANIGQFAIAASFRFPNSTIYSFEPVPDTFQNLVVNTSKASNIECNNFALGQTNGTVEFYQNNYSHVSSALKIDQSNENINYDKGVKNVLNIPVKRLDSILSEANMKGKTLLKLDVQGYEKNVIEGSSAILQFVDIILLEISFVSLYENQPLFTELNEFLRTNGYEFVAPLSFHKGKANRIIEMDALYRRI